VLPGPPRILELDVDPHGSSSNEFEWVGGTTEDSGYLNGMEHTTTGGPDACFVEY